jgi:hypothetical protein
MKKFGRRIAMAVCAAGVLLLAAASPSRAQDLRKLATDVAARIHAMNHERVTVVDFVDLDKKPSRLGKYLAQQLQTNLAEPDLKLTVVDQSQLGQLLDQMSKLNEGLIDPTTSRELGKVAATEVIIIGTVMPSSMTVRLEVRAIDLQTAKLVTGGSTSLARMGMVDRLLGDSGDGGAESAAGGKEGKGKPGSGGSHVPVRSRHDQGVAFDLQGCSLSGDALTCAVMVTSEGHDRSLSVGFTSRAWNTDGEEFGPDDVTIANLSKKDSCIEKQILKDVPTRMSLTFPKFGADDSQVERLRLQWGESDNCWNARWRPVEFEKIAVSDDTDFSSSHGKTRAGGGRASASGGGKATTPGGFLQGLTGKALDIFTKVIDNKTKKYTGDDGDDTSDDSSTSKKKKSTKPPQP